MLKRTVSGRLACGMLFGMVGCGGQDPAETTVSQIQPTKPVEDPVITARRAEAEAYMRQMANYMWRPQENIVYTKSTKVLTEADLEGFEGDVFTLKAGRLYRGIPYSYSGASAWNFYDYASEPDSNGIAAVSGVHWRSLNGKSGNGACLGNDCSGAVQLAWNYVGSKVMLASTEYMCADWGYLPVGDYYSYPEKNIITVDTCTGNGEPVMHAAYAKLQMADAVVRRSKSAGHTMMIVENHPAYLADGTVDGQNSYVTVLHQTSRYITKEEKEFDPTYGEDVYKTFGIDDKFTYAELFAKGYLPITCDVFVSAEPVEEPWVKDSETEYSYDSILKGNFSSNRILSALTITVTDGQGNVITEATAYGPRQAGKNEFTFLPAWFGTNMPELMRGSLDLALAPGAYHCTHTLRDAHGVEYVMRDFDFTVE